MFLGTLVLPGCSPGLDWREVRAAQGRVVALFPCKPKAQDRVLPVAAGADWPATLQVCDAQDMTFAVLTLTRPEVSTAPSTAPSTVPSSVPSSVPVVDLASARSGLQRSAVQRWGPIDADPGVPAGLKLPTVIVPHWQRHRRSGSDGRSTETLALFFEHQGSALQITLSGSRLDPAVAEAFFAGLRLEP